MAETRHVIFDMNGTLVLRSREKIAGANLIARLTCGKYLYSRPGAVAILKILSARYRVHICTGMTTEDALECLGDAFPEWEQHITKPVLSREYTLKVSQGKSFVVVRNIPAILRAIRARSIDEVIFVDDHKSKLPHVDNKLVIIVPTISVAELVSGNVKVVNSILRTIT